MRKLLSALLLAAAATSAARSEPIEIAVRDARTGAPVPAVLRLAKAEGEGVRSPRVNARGRLRLELAAGVWTAEVGAPAYRTQRARLVVAAGAPRLWAFELEPLRATRPREAEADLAPAGVARLVGVVRAEESGEPIADAEVSLGSGARSLTDHDGSFALELPASEPEPANVDGLTLEIAAPGRRTLRLDGVLPVAGTTRLPLRLRRGEGTERRSVAHRIVGAGDGRSGGPMPLAAEGETPRGELAPPASVRVGFGDLACSVPCCTGACTAVCVLPLESYVARGLNDEWISSWNGASLRAGAIAYRSYAAYRVDHPSTPEFDLCSSACCQVNDPDTAAATDAAVAATAGILLERNGAAFSAEYSAENNSWDDPEDGLSCSNADLSCGDGAVGSPALGWPCLDDAVALGHGCFGHGRGMSQWGSMRWGRDHGWSWREIADHYYNASGSPGGLRSAFLASPARIDAGRLCPAATGAGDRVRLHLDATDLAALPHPAVLFGASVVAPGGAWISDPDDDAPAPLVPGPANRESRWFDLPADAAPGTYDAALALWLDVDGDGEITAADFRLDLALLPDALEVASGVDLVFADCFESADLSGWSSGSQ